MHRLTQLIAPTPNVRPLNMSTGQILRHTLRRRQYQQPILIPVGNVMPMSGMQGMSGMQPVPPMSGMPQFNSFPQLSYQLSGQASTSKVILLMVVKKLAKLYLKFSGLVVALIVAGLSAFHFTSLPKMFNDLLITGGDYLTG